jgi:hypothetical protein
MVASGRADRWGLGASAPITCTDPVEDPFEEAPVNTLITIVVSVALISILVGLSVITSPDRVKGEPAHH